MPDAATELLETVKSVAVTQDVMLRRQLALEQVFGEIRRDLEAWREQSTQTAQYASRIAVLEYQVAEIPALKETVRTLGGRLSLIYMTILIVLVILGVPLVILVAR